jgi:antitoxin YefM
MEVIMEVSTYTQVRKNFATVIDKVCDDHMPLIVTRQKGRAAVLISLEDYNSLRETLYLLSSRNNADRLLKSIQDAEEGKLLSKTLIEE